MLHTDISDMWVQSVKQTLTCQLSVAEKYVIAALEVREAGSYAKVATLGPDRKVLCGDVNKEIFSLLQRPPLGFL